MPRYNLGEPQVYAVDREGKVKVAFVTGVSPCRTCRVSQFIQYPMTFLRLGFGYFREGNNE